MIEYAARYLNPLDLLAARRDDRRRAPATVPEVLVDQLTWTYLGGQRFVTELRELAGELEARRLRARRRARRRPPSRSCTRASTCATSARSRCAIDRRRARRRAAGAAPTATCSASSRPSQLLERRRRRRRRASAAAAGWDGDRYELWRRDVAPGRLRAPVPRGPRAGRAAGRWDTRRRRGRVRPRRGAATSTDGLGGEPAGERVWAVDGGCAALAGAGRETSRSSSPPTGDSRARSPASRSAAT